MLRARHSAERILKAWGGSTDVSVEKLNEEIDMMLREYLVSGDLNELDRCLRSLRMPFFHHEFVERAVVIHMETRDSKQVYIFTNM